MEKDQAISVKDAVHKLQLSLLEGIRHENQLFAAGSLMSQSDYEDVVTERSISNLCGYPLCANPLPSERPRKGRYRISLKEHKVYDLQETYMFCSSGCVVNSRAFAGSLQEERCLVSNSTKINEVLRMFGDVSFHDKEGLGKKGDLDFSDLRIQEKVDTNVGEMSLEDWIGPSNAIEGYVPQRDPSSKSSHSKNRQEGSKSEHTKPKKGKGKAIKDMDFKSTIIMGDQFRTPKTSSDRLQIDSETKLKESKGKTSSNHMGDHVSMLEKSSAPMQNGYDRKLIESKGEVSLTVPKDQLHIPKTSLSPSQNGSHTSLKESKGELCVEKTIQSNEHVLKSSLKSSGAKKLNRSITWADERKIENRGNGNLCNVREMGDTPESIESTGSLSVEDDDGSLRLASAEACAIALSQAAEAIASGDSDVIGAVSEAGIIILPHPHDVGKGESQKDEDVLDLEPIPLKLLEKSVNLHSDLFNSENSWYDSSPEGFSLTLSSFSTMWMALFGWITSSSLAYIYGRDESSHEDYLMVNGREYPCKIFLSDGRSSEIKQTLSGCLARALPGLITDLRLSTQISTLEHGMVSILNISFDSSLMCYWGRKGLVLLCL
ncbi:hypothetical protein HHK36_012176 [Tetracentron sinense]|uniref:RNA polymerase II subunit B1 CTD phosphatase RPAP2 homolog n=1 Tax=Tetracentron sinense TaxID=13715 RepID=A0A834Z4A1_TETSI|nr:hypothetical protein HHK36_012176 [Tetracentron sinense]